MSGILKFFLNAIKAIFLGPFYIAYFCIYVVISAINHVFGEFKVLLTGFKYGQKNNNKYTKNVNRLIRKSGGK